MHVQTPEGLSLIFRIGFRFREWFRPCVEWTEDKLSRLPVRKGFRQRGEAMTRIEIFSDAAFAFAVTMLVVSLSSIPQTYEELMEAMKGVPAFAAAFAQIMVFWVAHRRWSQRYGLDDAPTTLLTLGMIFVVLVYVYPLKLMMASFFHYISGGWFPSEFLVDAAFKMSGLVIVYGIGVALLAGLLALLYLRSQAVADSLKLNNEERLRTRLDLIVWSIHSCVGLLSALFAWLLPERIGVYGGFVYFLLPATIPFVGVHFGRRIRALGGPLPAATS